MGKRERIRARQLKKKALSGKGRRGGGGAQLQKLRRQQKRIQKRSAPTFSNPLRYPNPDCRILVLGDGDFSFTVGLVAHVNNGKAKQPKSTRRDGRRKGGTQNAKHQKLVSNIVATGFDTEKTVLSKYETAKQNIAKARAKGVVVVHGIDATLLGTPRINTVLAEAEAEAQHSSNEQGMKPDASKSELILKPFDRIVFNFPHTGKQRVHDNRAMLSSFLTAAKKIIAPGGQVGVDNQM